jgi:hypothetical protein
MGTHVVRNLKMLGQFVQKAGPYVLIELVLPGGTLIALVLYLYRNGYLRLGLEVALRIGNVLDQALDPVRDIVLFVQPSDIAALVASGRDGTHDGLEPLAMAPAA